MTLLKQRYLTVLFMLIFSVAFAQEKFTLSGTISDVGSNETLIGASVYIVEVQKAVSTNEYGFYSISLPEGTYTIQISYVSFSTIQKTVILNQNIRENYQLTTDTQELNEVVITENKKRANIRKPQMSVNTLSVEEIKKMPVVLGEVDVLKSLLQLPGVTNAGEGASGFNVRGGGADQNLILLDEATIFNSSHLFGFFSVFNSDAIKDIKLYKGGIPARFGGRTSSVLEIYQKEGNSKEFHMNGGIGLISSRVMAEGPISKDRGSFLIAGRASYAHLFLKLANQDNSAYFYDLNTKLSYKLNENNNLYLSGYFGRDLFEIDDLFSNTYGNTVVNLRWNHLFSDRLFSNFSTIYSDYYYGLELGILDFKWDSGIKNYNFKYDLKHYISNNFKLKYGVNAIYYDFNPGKITPTGSQSSINERQLEKKYAFEPAIYLEAEHRLSDKITMSYGVRYSMFYRLGAQTINLYENNQAVNYDSDLKIYEKADPIGNKRYSSGQTIADFNNLEPRATFAYELNNNQSIKASYNRMVQYLNLVSNTSSPTPLDIWTPSGLYIDPQILDQVALGYFRNFSDDKYSLEVETFYKKTKNRLDYIDGADLIANEAIEQVILNGEARAYGLELLLRKNEGKLTGFIAYTLSRSEQRTPGRTAEEVGINNGDWYRTGFDKLHDLSVTASYELDKKWSFGTTFSLQSGRATTYPKGQYTYGDVNIPIYGNRNGDALPAYHHLDISATYTPKPEKKKGWQGEWVFSIYNLYNRQNAASMTFRQNENTGINESVKTSIFGVVPSITYNFKF
ncbi:TonB-dependent receptor [Flavobacterium arcticum]|uniref:TonB-dependent receptor n=1 Tax=Flavobacterium arcticum TaxID=1784713 RepID=A0A345HDK2_9FLAO|nr:TonB-dependent receptor [Flavobacterium arcticum]AXG74662.1 TonB-dependent receptor [Flavobacterium arcticum]KAF2512212.1 TonB-dependent receptor [Flavobacterium arcticum]